MGINHNVVGWFEIPVTNMERAIKFYSTVFEVELTRMQAGPEDMAFFPWVENSMGAGGCLVHHPGYYSPSKDGVVIYFTAWSGDAAIELSRVEAAGGKVLQEKKQISPEHGFMGLILDTEGNRIAVHSRV
ncbi:MAG: VOC family protein [Bacteroidales bacterium]|nr:VOC family protein [Bacteroidales bacterium]